MIYEARSSGAGRRGGGLDDWAPRGSMVGEMFIENAPSEESSLGENFSFTGETT